MKVAFVGPFGLKPKATVSTRAVPLANALIERGHSVTIVIPPWDSPSDSGREMTFGEAHVLNVELPPPIPLLWYAILTWRLLRTILRLRPDLVHVFKPKAFAGLIASTLWLLNLTGITDIRIVVDTDDWEGVGGWNELGSYSWAQRLFFSLQEKWVLRQADAVTTASRELWKMVSGLLGDDERIFYLPNAVGTTSRLQSSKPATDVRAELGLGTSPVILLYTRFFEFRVDRVLDVLREVVQLLPEAKLLVVGRGFFGEERQLAQMAQTRGLAPHVVQAGWVDEPDLPHYFSTANVAVYPFDDTLINRTKCSVKLLDLLGAGLPVVADRVGQNSEYIEDGKSGVLTEPGDSRTMALALVKLMVEPDVGKTLGMAAQCRIRSQFNWSEWAPQAERAYEHTVNKKPSNRPIIAWLLAALWMGLIFYMSSQQSPPQLPQPILQTIVAKTAHFGEYAILALLSFRAYWISRSRRGGPKVALAFALLLSVVYAALDEWHQSFVPNRQPALTDVLIDTSGAFFTVGFLWRIARYRV